MYPMPLTSCMILVWKVGLERPQYIIIVIFNKDYNGLPHNIKLYINHRTFKSSYRIYVFNTRYQSDHIGPHTIQLNFKFSAAVADFICNALVLTRKVISVNNDGNKMVDIVSKL